MKSTMKSSDREEGLQIYKWINQISGADGMELTVLRVSCANLPLI